MRFFRKSLTHRHAVRSDINTHHQGFGNALRSLHALATLTAS